MNRLLVAMNFTHSYKLAFTIKINVAFKGIGPPQNILGGPTLVIYSRFALTQTPKDRFLN